MAIAAAIKMRVTTDLIMHDATFFTTIKPMMMNNSRAT
jgi:hypothetical protein